MIDLCRQGMSPRISMNVLPRKQRTEQELAYLKAVADDALVRYEIAIHNVGATTTPITEIMK